MFSFRHWFLKGLFRPTFPSSPTYLMGHLNVVILICMLRVRALCVLPCLLVLCVYLFVYLCAVLDVLKCSYQSGPCVLIGKKILRVPVSFGTKGAYSLPPSCFSMKAEKSHPVLL